MEKAKRALSPPSEDRDSRAVLDAIRKIVRALRVASRAAEKQTGLSGAQVFVLQKLAEGDAVSLNELAARTLTHQSSVSVVVQRLVERGLVRRMTSEVDGRRVELSLTPAGSDMIQRPHDLAQYRLINALKGMQKTHRKQLSVLLDDLLSRAGLSNLPATLFFEEDGAAAEPNDSQ